MDTITVDNFIRHKKKSRFALLRELGAFLFFLLIWAVAAFQLQKDFLLPRPGLVIASLLTLIRDGSEFWQTLGITMIRGGGAFLVSLLLGTVAALGAVKFGLVRLLLKPLLIVGRSVPVVAFILLMILWLPSDLVPVFVSVIVVVPLVYQNVYSGLQDRDARLMEMAQVFRFSSQGRFFHLTLPSLLPYLKAAIVSGLGISWKSVIAAEILSLPRWGIGSAMLEAQTLLDTSVLFAWTIVIILFSSFCEWGISCLLRQRGGRHA